MTRGGKIPRLIIMGGDKEVHNNIGERKPVVCNTQEYSPEVEPVSVGHNSKIIPSGGKILVKKIISDVAKKMRMN